MSAVVELGKGSGTTFSTWIGAGVTTLCVENLDKVNGGQVSVNAGVHGETIDVGPGASTSIKRQWGGVQVGVTNSGLSAVKVWTA
jgi:hypothetical protein